MKLLALAALFFSVMGVSNALAGPSASTTTKHTLFDVPMSNHGARCRIIAYKKDLPESEFQWVSPATVGGFRSEEYLAISPQGKVPSLKCHESGLCLSESDTVSRYLLSTYASQGPSFQPENPVSNVIARFHDIYLSSIQNCLYKPSPPFGIYGTRKDALKEFSKQLYVLAEYMASEGPYLCGSEVSLADATVFPTIVFASNMFPRFDHDITQPVPPKIETWFQRMKDTDAAFKKVYEEMMGGINGWDKNRRWDPIWLAGVRDEAPATLFDKIIAKEIPADIVREDDKILAFKDINPAAPAHVLVIPKDRDGLTRLRKATPEHIEILGRLLLAAGEIAKDQSLGFGDGARIVINDGEEAGQEVFHLHVHVLGGRPMTWPPG